MDNIREKIEELILKEIRPDLNIQRIEDEEPLIDSGILDSLGMLKILSFLDEEYNIDLSSDGIRPENFKNLKTICEMIEKGKNR
mgnify:CR=1 FL=1